MKIKPTIRLIQRLSFSHESGVPISSKYLRENEISRALAYKYVASHWLTKIGKGAYLFGNEKPSNYGVVSAILRDNGFHIGGRHALSLRGNIHYLRANERIDIFGNNPKFKIPLWAKPFNLKYTTKNPFDLSIPDRWFVSKLEDLSYPTLFVSERERAMLELIYGLGSIYAKEEVEQIVETLVGLRSKVIGTLLEHCDSIRTLKQCRFYAQRFDMPWKSVVNEICEGRKIK